LHDSPNVRNRSCRVRRIFDIKPSLSFPKTSALGVFRHLAAKVIIAKLFVIGPPVFGAAGAEIANNPFPLPVKLVNGRLWSGKHVEVPNIDIRRF
jgi:hypothetical protein